jgi:alpha-glucosidase (family GH31 glycosyl hydrolase)
MPQHEHVPRGYTEDVLQPPLSPLGVSLRSGDADTPFSFTFEAVRPSLFRTTFTSKTHPLPPHPSAPQPKVDLSGVQHASTSQGLRKKRIELGDITAVVEWKDTPVVSLSWTGSDKLLHRDLAFRSYVSDSTGIAHYTDFHKDALHVGLGEKSAPMDLSHRHFILSATDSFGYNVYRTDPLYKHIPLIIRADSEGVVAMFSTTHSRGTWSVGSEMDGLWGRFKVYRQDHGGLEEYLIVGRTLKDVVRSYADLVGYPLTVPRWSLGYLSGGMKYSMLDDPRAADALLEFAKEMHKHDIPCSGFQLSSGYTVAETAPKTRNVFTWNRHRFPDPETFIKQYHALGIRILANIKPYILSNHPKYKELVDAGALFTDPKTKGTGNMRLWSAGGGESGEGGHIDFTSAAGFRFWYEGVRELKRQGIDAMWNDNNEYTLPNDDWQAALEVEREIIARGIADQVPNNVGLWGRSLHTELMGRASHDALVDENPEERPFVLTRSATAGTMRYAASSWSGDNVTSWDGMKGANSLSLNAGMSLLHVRVDF